MFQIDTADTDNVMHEFRWGFRAEQELNKEDVLEVISQVRALDLNFKPQITVCQYKLNNILQMYDCAPTAFKEQYDKVQEQKKKAAGGGGGTDQEDEPMQGTSS